MGFVVLIIAGLILLGLSLLFAWLHRRYLLYLQITPVEKWRHVLSFVFGVLAALCLILGAAGWIAGLAGA